jgi:hypothetical protein
MSTLQLGTTLPSSSTSKRSCWQESIQRQRVFSEELLLTTQVMSAGSVCFYVEIYR